MIIYESHLFSSFHEDGKAWSLQWSNAITQTTTNQSLRMRNVGNWAPSVSRYATSRASSLTKSISSKFFTLGFKFWRIPCILPNLPCSITHMYSLFLPFSQIAHECCVTLYSPTLSGNLNYSRYWLIPYKIFLWIITKQLYANWYLTEK